MNKGTRSVIAEVVLFKVGEPLLGGLGGGAPVTAEQLESLLPQVRKRPNVTAAWIKDGQLIARVKMDKKSKKDLRRRLGAKSGSTGGAGVKDK